MPGEGEAPRPLAEPDTQAPLLGRVARLGWICAALIPADPGGISPSAIEAGVLTEFLPRALTLRPDLSDRFLAIADALPAAAPRHALQELRALPPEDFDLLAFVVAGAYFLSPRVNAAIGYPGQQALTGATDYDEIASAVSRVEARGPRYVQP